MKRNFGAVIGTLVLSILALLNLCAVCWAGPPGTPDSFAVAQIPRTPVGNVEVTAATVLAVAAYGYWKSRK